jgi:signal transduction histidine kinase
MAVSIKENRPLRDQKIVVKRQDGTHAFVAPHPTPIRNDAGDLIGAVNVLIDITEMKTENDQVQADRTAMERQVESFTAQIAHVQKMEAIGQIASGMAHDFNNVLQGIGSCLAALEQHITADEGRALLLDLRRGIERGGHLTQRLLEFTRSDDKTGIEADVAAVLERIRPMLERSMGGMIKVGFSVPAEPLLAVVDPSRLEVALINLAINARDAMPSGGFLSIQASSRLIAPPVSLPGILSNTTSDPDGLSFGEYVVVSVEDAGSGMPPEVLARVREPFFTTKEAGKGTGLGLSMVQEMAAQAGGCLDIRSEVGRGTTVTIFLPRVFLEAEQPVPEQPAPGPGASLSDTGGSVPPDGGGRVVLLVDDDEMIRTGATFVLESFGYRVLDAQTAEDALGILEDGAEIDVLVTDYAMPGMSGSDLAEAVRHHIPGLPVLIMTGYAERPRETDGVAYLQKPFQVEDLATELARITARAG